jgi:hypothetical protein
MPADLIGQNGLGHQMVEQAPQPTGQHQLACWPVRAVFPAPQPVEQSHLGPLQRHPQFIEEAGRQPDW